jgi:hypothetical protein
MAKEAEKQWSAAAAAAASQVMQQICVHFASSDAAESCCLSAAALPAIGRVWPRAKQKQRASSSPISSSARSVLRAIHHRVLHMLLRCKRARSLL